MTEDTYVLSNLLLPELQLELGKTRRALERVPERNHDFRPHEKSKSLIELANHLATVSGLAGTILISPSVELGKPNDPRKIVREATPGAILMQFEKLAENGETQLKKTSDQAFQDAWEASQQGKILFSGTRYMAYRNLAMNHMIHHRAQLGSYLRLLNIPVPSTFGPSADEQPA